jgi:hypothetical protein
MRTVTGLLKVSVVVVGMLTSVNSALANKKVCYSVRQAGDSAF